MLSQWKTLSRYEKTLIGLLSAAAFILFLFAARGVVYPFGSYEAHIDLNAESCGDRLWTYLTDPDYRPPWEPAIISVAELNTGSRKVGRTAFLVSQQFGVQTQLTEVITKYQENQLVGYERSGPLFNSQVSIQLGEIKEGCRVQYAVTKKWLGWGQRVKLPYLTWRDKEVLAFSLRQLKELVSKNR